MRKGSWRLLLSGQAGGRPKTRNSLCLNDKLYVVDFDNKTCAVQQSIGCPITIIPPLSALRYNGSEGCPFGPLELCDTFEWEPSSSAFSELFPFNFKYDAKDLQQLSVGKRYFTAHHNTGRLQVL